MARQAHQAQLTPGKRYTACGHEYAAANRDAYGHAPHEAFNQPPPLEPINLYSSDQALQDGVAREGGNWGARRLARYGELAGGGLMALGFEAKAHPPVLQACDRFGHGIDTVAFHPAYRCLMTMGKEHGIHSLPWTSPGQGTHGRGGPWHCSCKPGYGWHHALFRRRCAGGRA